MPRPRRRPLTERDFIRSLQDLRLKGLETGEFEPLSDRETFYLLLHQSGGQPVREDFILSPPLFQLETIQRRMAWEERDCAPDQPFTPSPETAISPG